MDCAPLRLFSLRLGITRFGVSPHAESHSLAAFDTAWGNPLPVAGSAVLWQVR